MKVISASTTSGAEMSTKVRASLRKPGIFLLLTAVVALVSGYAWGGCSSQSGDPALHLVELYTSSGCSSCPPAEKWMRSLRDSKDIAGLEFHVDYFNSMSWRDPFSSHMYTERQQALANATNRGQYYTPQIWLDGQLWQNWPRGAPPNPIKSTSPALGIKVVSGAPLRAAFDLRDQNGKVKGAYRLYAAITENSLTLSVTGGENKGNRLSDDNVVRTLVGPLPAADTSVEFKLPDDVNLSHSTVVAFLQNIRNNTIIDVVRVPLAECLKQ